MADTGLRVCTPLAVCVTSEVVSHGIHDWGHLLSELWVPMGGTMSFVSVATSNKSGFLLHSHSRQGEVYPTAAVWQSKTTCFLLFIETVTLSSVSPSDTLNKSDFQKSSMV